MSENFYKTMNFAKKMVRRSTNPYYRGKFALVTDVNVMARFDAVTQTMQRAAESMPEPYFLHFKIETECPADAVRIVPSILQSFNRTRTMRRAAVSGIRMCNLLSYNNTIDYVSDMVVSCAFDAVAISAGLAEYSSLGSHMYVQLPIPRDYLRRRDGAQFFANLAVEKFWRSSKLRRHSVFVAVESILAQTVLLRFEPKAISHIPLLSYILDAYKDYSDLRVEVGRGSRLIVAKSPLWLKEDYYIFKPIEVLNDIRFRRAAAFGAFHHNPDYKLY